jgi:hypothetical protein
VRDCEERLDNHEGKPRAKPNLLRPFPALPERPGILTYGQLMERLDTMLDRLWALLARDWPAAPTKDQEEYYTKIAFNLAGRGLRPSRARTI